jgi:hypothetical protein
LGLACQLSAPDKVKTREKGIVKETKATVPTTPAQAKTSTPAATTKKKYQLNSEKTFNKQAAKAGAIRE